MSSIDVYDLLLTGPCQPPELAAALANAFALPPAEIDVAAEDVDDRDWTASVLATYSERHGDIALSMSITAVNETGERPTEAALAARLAEDLGTPILYPACSYPPSAYWLTDGPSQPARARLEPSDEVDPSIEDDLSLTIAAVNRFVPALPLLHVTPIPEVIREHRLPTPLADALPPGFAEQQSARNALAAWESFVTRLTSGWPPDRWYPADYYAEDLGYRDDADAHLLALAPDLAATMASALRTLDEAYVRATIADDGVALSQALGIPAADLALRPARWRRRLANSPWPTPAVQIS
jgi:hypothetical protein